MLVLVPVTPVQSLQRVVAGLWNGPPDLSRPLRLEWRIVLGRWLGIACVGVALALGSLPEPSSYAAYGILIVAFGYCLGLVHLIKRHHPWLESGALATIADTFLCGLMFPTLGGFENPFYAVIYLVAISAGIRLGFWRGMLLAVGIAAMDGMGMLWGDRSLDSAYVLRSGVLFGIILITSYLFEESKNAEARLADRLAQSQELNRALEHQARHDQLTNLPNRTSLHERVEQAIAALADPGSGSIGLLVLGLDRFKEVNDTFGHQFGDVLLKQIGARLEQSIGSADCIARLGGDQFAVLLSNTDPQRAERAARELLATLDEPFTIADSLVDVGTSIGIALSPQHATEAGALLRRADVAMYVAKRGAKGYATYCIEQDQHSPERLALMGELRRAIENDELTLWYQPKVSLKSRRCVGVEALVRWQHPQRGMIPPDQFIPLAEQTGMIKSLSRWVLNTAMRQAHEWQRAGVHVPIAVNLSMRDLHDPELPDAIAALLMRWQIPADLLQVEITEDGLMAEPARAFQTVTGLRALGLRIAIDDFGTGYSSLAYLKKLPVDELKIDRGFVRDLCDDNDDRAIVRSTVGLGHDLGLSIVAEGVEDVATLELLRQMGCDIAQGYHLGRPVPANEFVQHMAETLHAA